MKLRFQNYKEKNACKIIYDISAYYFKKMKVCKGIKYSREVLEDERTRRFGNGPFSFERQENGLGGEFVVSQTPGLMTNQPVTEVGRMYFCKEHCSYSMYHTFLSLFFFP